MGNICVMCKEEDIDVANCDGCDRLICPECVKHYKSDPLKIVAVCNDCLNDKIKEIALTKDFTKEFVARQISKLN